MVKKTIDSPPIHYLKFQTLFLSCHTFLMLIMLIYYSLNNYMIENKISKRKNNMNKAIKD